MLTSIMYEAGYYRSIGDKGVFMPTSTSMNAIIGTWVDNLIGIAADNRDLNTLEEKIGNRVELER